MGSGAQKFVQDHKCAPKAAFTPDQAQQWNSVMWREESHLITIIGAIVWQHSGVHCDHARIKLSRYYLQQQCVRDCGDYKMSWSHLLSPQKSVHFHTCWGEKCAIKNLRIRKSNGDSCLFAAAPELVLIQPNCQKWLLPAQSKSGLYLFSSAASATLCTPQSCTVGVFIAGEMFHSS